MDSIFLLSSNGEVVIHPDAVSLVPEFSNLSSDDVRYLVLAYDVQHSIFKQMPREDWPKLSCRTVFGHEDFEKIERKPSIHKALVPFKKLVYDEKRVMKHKFLKRKRDLENDLLTANGKEFKDLNQTISLVADKIKELDMDIATDDDLSMLANKNAKRSMVEIFMEKLKLQQQ